MKLAATIARSLQAGMQAELRAIERAVASGTKDAGRGLKAGLRRQVTGAGLGQRLANSWRDKRFYDCDDMTTPFSGYKQSGIGRDKSLHALEKYTELKTIWMRRS